MPRRFSLVVAIATLSLMAPFACDALAADKGAPAASPAAAPLKLKVAAGDVIAQKGDDGVWHAARILQVDRMPDGELVAHCLFYGDAKQRPAMDQLGTLGVRNAHVMILAKFFEKGWERVGNHEASKAEMAGYYTFLKQEDFPRYVKLMGLDENAIQRTATEHYQKAVALDDKGDKRGAIIEYSIALDAYPMFVDAIDNRGLDFMDLGHCKEAIEDFELSLRFKPDGEAAFVSRGQCLLALGKGKEAEAVFAQAIKRFPAHKADLQKSLEQARAAQKAH